MKSEEVGPPTTVEIIEPRRVWYSTVVRALSGWLLLIGVVSGLVIFQTRGSSGFNEAGRGDSSFARIPRRTNASPIWSIAYSPDGGLLATTTIWGDVSVIAPSQGELVDLQRGPKSLARRLAFTPDNQSIGVVGDGARVKFWHAQALNEEVGINTTLQLTRSLAFAQKSSLMAVGGEGGSQVELWDWKARRKLGELGVGVELKRVCALAFSSDDVFLAVGDDSGMISVWELATNRLRSRWRGHESGVVDLAFTKGGSRLLTSGRLDPVVKVFDATSGAALSTIPGHLGGVTALGLLRDGSMLAVAALDGRVCLYDAERFQKLSEMRGESSICALAFSQDGKVLATGGLDGVIRFWDVRELISNGLADRASDLNGQ